LKRNLAGSAGMSEADCVGGSQIWFDGVNTMKMTEQQQHDYKMYRAECLVSNVEPVRADFLAGELPDSVCYQLELQQNELGSMKAFAATAWVFSFGKATHGRQATPDGFRSSGRRSGWYSCWHQITSHTTLRFPMTLDLEVDDLLFLMQLVTADLREKKFNGSTLNEAQWADETALLARLSKSLPVVSTSRTLGWTTTTINNQTST
jgi:hypothetical protein